FTKSATAHMKGSFTSIHQLLVNESKVSGKKAGEAFSKELNKAIKDKGLKVSVSCAGRTTSVKKAVSGMKKDLDEVSKHAATVSERAKQSLTKTFKNLRSETRLVAAEARQVQHKANIDLRNARRLVQEYGDVMAIPWRSVTRAMSEAAVVARETANVSANANRALKNSSEILKEVYGSLADTGNRARLTIRDLYECPADAGVGVYSTVLQPASGFWSGLVSLCDCSYRRVSCRGVVLGDPGGCGAGPSPDCPY